jgi:hypothetical protein
MTSLAKLLQLHLIVSALNSVVGLMTSLSKRQESSVFVVAPKTNTNEDYRIQASYAFKYPILKVRG